MLTTFGPVTCCFVYLFWIFSCSFVTLNFLVLFITMLKLFCLKMCIRWKQHRCQHVYAKSVP